MSHTKKTRKPESPLDTMDLLDEGVAVPPRPKPTPRQLALVADMLECGEPTPANKLFDEYDEAIALTIAWLREAAGPAAVAEINAAIDSCHHCRTALEEIGGNFRCPYCERNVFDLAGRGKLGDA